MSMHLVEQQETWVARPLNVLAKLIHQELKLALEAGREAAEKAAIPHWLEIGRLANEAKPGCGRGGFQAWVQQQRFDVGFRQLQTWMVAARATTPNIEKRGYSMEETLRHVDAEKGTSYARGPVTSRTDWHNPVKEILGKINLEALQQEELKRAEERELQRKLAMKLIDIGYKVLASELHPDKKGGSREAMSRLNDVRARLRQHA